MKFRPQIHQDHAHPLYNLAHYHKIKEIIPNYYEYKKTVDNNGCPFPSQITVSCPKIVGNKMIQKLIEFDK